MSERNRPQSLRHPPRSHPASRPTRQSCLLRLSYGRGIRHQDIRRASAIRMACPYSLTAQQNANYPFAAACQSGCLHTGTTRRASPNHFQKLGVRSAVPTLPVLRLCAGRLPFRRSRPAVQAFPVSQIRFPVSTSWENFRSHLGKLACSNRKFVKPANFTADSQFFTLKLGKPN